MALTQAEEQELAQLEAEQGSQSKQSLSNLTPQEEAELAQLEGQQGQGTVQRNNQQVSIGQMLLNNLISATKTTGETGKDILNKVTLGIPEAISQKVSGQSFVDKSQIPQSQQVGNELLASTVLPVAALKGASGLIKGTGLGKSVLRGLVGGAASGAVMPVENFTNIGERARNTVLGGIMGSAVSLGAEGIGKIAKIMKGGGTPEEVAGLMKNVRQDFSKVKQDATDLFGAKLAREAEINPGAITPEAGDLFQTLKNNPEEYQDALPIIKRIPGLKEVIADPSKADQLTAGQLQDWINHIQTKVPANIKANNLDLLNFVSDLKGAQLEAFPNMAQYRDEYRKVIEPYNQLKSQFKFNRLQNAIQNDFGGAEGMKALKELLPQETIDKMGGYKKATENAKFAKDILGKIIKGGAYAAGATAVGGVGYETYKHLSQ